jgi:hypothetical protein
VRFPEFPDRVLLLAAGHVVLPTFAQQGDAITAADTGAIIGRLLTWTTIDGDPTTDAALVWVDPAAVSPRLRGLPQPKGVNLHPLVGDRVFIVPHQEQQAPREARIHAVRQDVTVTVIGPGWPSAPAVAYKGQVLTDRLFSEAGDSGAVVLDDRDRVVGMVVAGSGQIGTVITPIAPILANPAWGGRQLELVTQIVDGAVGPPTPTEVPTSVPLSTSVDLSWLDPNQSAVASEVCERLAAGGLGAIQQAAALGNAVAESALDPRARPTTAKEDSVGLFQLNRKGGEGTGYTVAEFERIDVQCAIVLDRVAGLTEFVNATSIDAPVDVFVRKFERPANPELEIPKRLHNARRFLAA